MGLLVLLPYSFQPITAATSMAIHARSQPDAGADDLSPSPTPAARSSPSRIFAGPPTARGWADGSSTTASSTFSPVAGGRDVVSIADLHGAADGSSATVSGTWRPDLECHAATALPPPVSVARSLPSCFYRGGVPGRRGVVIEPSPLHGWSPPHPLSSTLLPAAATITAVFPAAAASPFASIRASTTPNATHPPSRRHHSGSRPLLHRPPPPLQSHSLQTADGKREREREK
uniref:Uncharacterized protein n=1 Tax=Oryza sativa subsp. japonica TaxID=39947 RepID=Q6ER80_ORYSJ|nr:hypothetical protein [Oryza sativa Japonica Group]